MSASSDVMVPPELAGAVDGLVEEFTGVFAREAIADCVLDSYRQLRPARVESAPLETVRAVRDDISARVRTLLTELDATQVAR
jgi:hypothetical protein